MEGNQIEEEIPIAAAARRQLRRTEEADEKKATEQTVPGVWAGGIHISSASGRLYNPPHFPTLQNHTPSSPMPRGRTGQRSDPNQISPNESLLPSPPLPSSAHLSSFLFFLFFPQEAGGGGGGGGGVIADSDVASGNGARELIAIYIGFISVVYGWMDGWVYIRARMCGGRWVAGKREW